MSTNHSLRLKKGPKLLIMEDKDDDLSSEFLTSSTTKLKHPLPRFQREVVPVGGCWSNDDDDHHHHHNDHYCCTPTTTTQCTSSEQQQFSTITNIQKKQKKKKCVRFDTVEIREYPIQLGSSIPTSCGPPLGIDWFPVSQSITTVENYERQHPDRLREKSLLLPCQQRIDVLSRQGVDSNDIKSSILSCDRIRKSRITAATRCLRWGRFQRVFILTTGKRNTP